MYFATHATRRFRSISAWTVAIGVMSIADAGHAQETPSSPAWYERASEKDAEEEARREAQYARNHWALRAGGGRSRDGKLGDAWEARTEGAFIVPFADGAGPLFVLVVGFSFWHRNSDAFGAALPLIGVAYGYRTPFFVAYGGLTYSITLDAEAEPPGQAGGVFANAGIDFGPIELLGDARAEQRFYKAGKSRSHLSYGGLVSVDFE